MISNNEEYAGALREIEYLDAWLGKLAKEFPRGERGLTMAGIRKKLAKIQEELAVFEAERGIAAAKLAGNGNA